MISPLNAPVNVRICSTNGTIFSSSSGSGGGGGQTYNFSNIGNGARVLGSVLGGNVPYRSLLQGNNLVITEEQSDIRFDVDDLLFDSTKPSTSSIPGLGGVALGKSTILTTIQALLYPIRNPGAQLVIAPTLFEFGDAGNIIANWTATRTDEDIKAISVNGQSQAVTNGQTQSGQMTITKNGQGSVTVPMSVATLTRNSSISAISTAMRKIRYGYLSKDGMVSVLTDTDLNSGTISSSFYSGSGTIGPFQFNIPVNNYLVICIPTIFGNNWGFLVNGFNNNAFNQVRTNQPFVNSFGFSDPVNVWVSQSFATGPILLQPYPTN